MDGQRFDDLARKLATGTSRRRFVKGLATSALVALGVRAGGTRFAAASGDVVTCAGAGDACSVNSDCCAGQCSSSGFCYCQDASRPALGCPCTTGTQNACGDTTLLCCSSSGAPGSTGVCTSASVGCNPTGGGAGSPCTTGTQNACADGLSCCSTGGAPGSQGVCRTSCGSAACAGAGDTCSSDSDCCAGKCDATQKICYCTDVSRPTVGCPCSASNPNTCGGRPDLCCSNGTCASPMVGCNPTGGGNGAPCTTGTQNACSTGFQCCPTTTLAGGPGVCTPSSQTCPTVLPNTGVGKAGPEQANWVTPAALVGAGAALAASKLRRKQAPETE